MRLARVAMVTFLSVTILTPFARPESYHKQVIKKPVGQLMEVKNYPDYEQVPILESVGKDTRADIRLYIEASNPKKEKFALFNLAISNNSIQKINASFQATFYDSSNQVIGVAGIGGSIDPQKKTSFIAGMQYIPPHLMKEIKSCEAIYYEWVDQ